MSMAVVIARKKGTRDLPRVMVFESHHDAIAAAYQFKQIGWTWEMHVCELYAQGEQPDLDVRIQEQMF